MLGLKQSAVLKAMPAFKKLKQQQMEHIFDRCGCSALAALFDHLSVRSARIALLTAKQEQMELMSE
jgi:hypothetical protein